jgi:hypothetical protein
LISAAAWFARAADTAAFAARRPQAGITVGCGALGAGSLQVQGNVAQRLVVGKPQVEARDVGVDAARGDLRTRRERRLLEILELWPGEGFHGRREAGRKDERLGHAPRVVLEQRRERSGRDVVGAHRDLFLDPGARQLGVGLRLVEAADGLELVTALGARGERLDQLAGLHRRVQVLRRLHEVPVGEVDLQQDLVDRGLHIPGRAPLCELGGCHAELGRRECAETLRPGQRQP